MRTTKKVLAVLTAMLASLLTLAPMTALADAYTPVSGTTTTFTKYLAVESDAEIPEASFSFTIAAGTAVSDSTVMAGPDAGAVTVGTAAFTAGQTATAGAANDGIVNTADQKYASAAVTVDFTGVTFSEPGIYRYVLTETASAAANVVNDSEAARTIDVYVLDNDGTLEVDSYVMYEGEKTGLPGDAGDVKSAMYVNEVLSQDLSFEKTVTGNQGSRDKYFKFTLSITGAGAGTIVPVDMSGAETAPARTSATVYEASAMAAANNVETLTADAQGAITHDFYLAHGDKVEVTGLPKGCSYTVSEEKEDYENSSATQSGTLDADTDLTFVNSRAGTVPTGVMMTVIPGVMIAAAGLAGLLLLRAGRREI